jgi:WD40 repeat protein
VITDHKSPITDVDFNTDGNSSTFIATSSLDNTARIYHIAEINDPPITFTIRNTHIYTVEFTWDNQYIFVGAEQKILKKFPIESSIMADKICDYITREFTDEEWEAYIGEGVEKENTCNVMASGR